jgi:hypothetical protein
MSITSPFFNIYNIIIMKRHVRSQQKEQAFFHFSFGDQSKTSVNMIIRAPLTGSWFRPDKKFTPLFAGQQTDGGLRFPPFLL